MRKTVAIVGATGIAGQQFIVSLQNHKWFKIKKLAASEKSAGRSYQEAIQNPNSGTMRWWSPERPNKEILNMEVENAGNLDAEEVDIVFSAVESDAALSLEPRYAKTTPVISTASAFRYDEDVPILVPGVNLEHTELIRIQKRNRSWQGFVTPIPNCTVTGLVIALKPIYDAFGLDKVLMTSMQAVSGAGRSPGVLSLDIQDNIIPFIPKEEEKVQKEALKILGKLNIGKVDNANLKVSATCTRVNVSDGHTESVFLSTKKPCSVEEVTEELRNFGKDFVRIGLPSAPREMIVVHEDQDRPQPRIDRDIYNGMATSVGRIRKDNVLENGIKFVLLSHNTKMGAAKGATLIAEYLIKKGYIK
ncbi:aspartate-semialdehyde dehydrogenase [Candidatus Micrarchaeota archaeon]|nr:aspartate-semialdehyde dehydrogenase [Candidatus Micrarchaeota archaeon]